MCINDILLAGVTLHVARFTVILIGNIPTTSPQVWTLIALILFLCIGAIAYSFIPDPKQDFFKPGRSQNILLGALAFGIICGAAYI